MCTPVQDGIKYILQIGKKSSHEHFLKGEMEHTLLKCKKQLYKSWYLFLDS